MGDSQKVGWSREGACRRGMYFHGCGLVELFLFLSSIVFLSVAKHVYQASII